MANWLDLIQNLEEEEKKEEVQREALPEREPSWWEKAWRGVSQPAFWSDFLQGLKTSPQTYTKVYKKYTELFAPIEKIWERKIAIPTKRKTIKGLKWIGQKIEEEEERAAEDVGLRPPFYPPEKWAEIPKWVRIGYELGTIIGGILAGGGWRALDPKLWRIFLSSPQRYQLIFEETFKGSLTSPTVTRRIIGRVPTRTSAPSVSREAQAFLRSLPAAIRQIEPAKMRFPKFYKEIQEAYKLINRQIYPSIADELAKKQASEAVKIVKQLSSQGYDFSTISKEIGHRIAMITPQLVDKLKKTVSASETEQTEVRIDENVREIINSLNIDTEAKEEFARAVKEGKKPDIAGILGRFFNRIGMEWQMLPREEQRRAMQRHTEEMKKAWEEIQELKEPKPAIPEAKPLFEKKIIEEELKTDTWSDKSIELPEAVKETVKAEYQPIEGTFPEEPIPLKGEVEKIPVEAPKPIKLEEGEGGQLYIPGTKPPELSETPEKPPEPPDSLLAGTGMESQETPRLGFGVYLNSFEHWAMDIEHRTGKPVYSKIVRPQIEAAKERMRLLNEVEEQIKDITSDLSPEEINRITHYMKQKQVGKVEVELAPKEAEAVQKIRALFDFGFKYFGVEPERYIEDYIPLLRKIEEKPQKGREKIPLKWLGFPSEVQPFFEKARKATKYIEDFNIIDLIRLYFQAGSWAKYRNTMTETREDVEKMPLNIKNEILKWENFLTGGKGDFEKVIEQDLAAFFHKISAGAIPEDVDVPQTIVNLIYLGGLGLRPSSAAKNLTQSLHNWSEMPARWMFIGNKLFFSKEGQQILKKSGIMTGYAPYTTRYEWAKAKGEKALEKFIRMETKARDIGLYLFQTVDRYNRGTIYLAEWARTHYWADKLNKGEIDFKTFARKVDLMGVHPTYRKFLLDNLTDVQYLSMGGEIRKIKDVDKFADALADYRQMLTQYRYMKEVRPQWMRSGIGKMAGQFLTWPTYYARFQLERPKRAIEAFKEGEVKAGISQIWKLIKYIIGALAIYKGVKKTGVDISSWFKPIPTGLGPAIETPWHLYQWVANKVKGYDWAATQEWWRVKNSWKVFVPFYLQIEDVAKALGEKEKDTKRRILEALGLPLVKEKPKKKLGIDYQWENLFRGGW